MKNKIGFICIGQCGGNIGSLLEQQGYNCLFINTSREDLSTLNSKYRFHIEGGEGCSHDRDKAIMLGKKNYRRIIEEVADKLYHQQLIYLCFSTGGGTGSGLSSIFLEMLNASFPAKHFGCIMVLPDENELPKPQYNSFQCYKEITNIDKLASVFTIDNNKGDKFILNQRFVNRFNKIINIPAHVNLKGNIDNAELFKILTTRGAIFTANCSVSNPDNLTSAILKSCEQSDIFADLENDKQIMYMGLSLQHDINIADLQRTFGTPYDVFINYNI